MRKKGGRGLAASECWLRWLHLLFSAIFGLVLPFICWGAEATPGHAHARAHFVFLPPPAYSANVISQETGTAHDLIHAKATTLASGLGEPCATPLHRSPSAHTTPVSQSTPQVLAVTMLLLMALSLRVTPVRQDGGGFHQYMATLHAYAPPLVIATPPPR
jgi:hypothetical protein